MPVAFEMVDIDTHWVGAAEADRTIDAMIDALGNMHDVVEGIRDDMYRHTLAQFESRGGVSGSVWDALDPSTVAEKQAAGSLTPDWPLVRTGELLESATSPIGEYSGTEVLRSEAWIDVDWQRDGWQIPVLHQEGVPERLVHRRAYTRSDGVKVSGATYLWHLPARPIFTITDELVDKGADRIIAHVFNPFA